MQALMGGGAHGALPEPPAFTGKLQGGRYDNDGLCMAESGSRT